MRFRISSGKARSLESSSTALLLPELGLSPGARVRYEDPDFTRLESCSSVPDAARFMVMSHFAIADRGMGIFYV